MKRNTERPAVLIVGIGEVGRYLLEFIARENLDVDVFAADVQLDSLRKKVDNAVIGAALHGRHPSITPLEIDLYDVDRTAMILNNIQPAVVINCAVMQTWHVIRRLPEEVYARLSSATLGAWLPVQLTLAMKVAQAIKASGIKTHYINTSLSDLTNPSLKTVGLAPTTGIGNIALIEPAVRTLVARKTGQPRTSINLKMIAHHIHWVVWREAGYKEGAPCFMQIFFGDEDITEQFEVLSLMKEAILLYATGTAFSAVSASSALQNLKALLSPQPVYLHSPGPNGLPGGYPVVMSENGVQVDLPAPLTFEKAIAINEQAQTFDGIKEINANGRVHFMPYTIEIMREMLGFECESFMVLECEALAREQVALFHELEKKHGLR